jgi:hypothetical protein
MNFKALVLIAGILILNVKAETNAVLTQGFLKLDSQGPIVFSCLVPDHGGGCYSKQLEIWHTADDASKIVLTNMTVVAMNSFSGGDASREMNPSVTVKDLDHNEKRTISIASHLSDRADLTDKEKLVLVKGPNSISYEIWEKRRGKEVLLEKGSLTLNAQISN